MNASVTGCDVMLACMSHADDTHEYRSVPAAT